jgi:FkbM family methyltransferase
MKLGDWRINFFDLGMFTGEETAAFLRLTDQLVEGRERPIVCAYGIEPNRALATYCTNRFADRPRVFVHQFAIGSSEKQSELYIGNVLEGSSLYRQKHDVGGTAVFVNEKRFSVFLRELRLDVRLPDTVNIIKANIEGAEWDLIQDLEANDIWDLFDIYLGDDQWTADMKKCAPLLDKIGDARRILNQRIIRVLPFCMGTENYPNQLPNYDLLTEIRRKIYDNKQNG